MCNLAFLVGVVTTDNRPKPGVRFAPNSVFAAAQVSWGHHIVVLNPISPAKEEERVDDSIDAALEMLWGAAEAERMPELGQ